MNRKSAPFSICMFSFLCVLQVILIGCNRNDAILFDIQEGQALYTLKVFAEQANVEILMDENDIKGVNTPSISGRMSAKAALKKLLADTTLQFEQDPQTNAIAVFRKNRLTSY